MHVFAGLLAVPTNWWDLTAKTDAFHLPEIIPGLPVEHKLRFENFVAQWEIRKF
jgi:hypothetical protein